MSLKGKTLFITGASRVDTAPAGSCKPVARGDGVPARDSVDRGDEWSKTPT
jgi:hypothetical protein